MSGVHHSHCTESNTTIQVCMGLFLSWKCTLLRLQCHHSRASLLNLTHIHMGVVSRHSLACYFPLEHLLKVVLVIPMLQVEPVLAIQEPIRLQLILEINRLIQFPIPCDSVIEAVRVLTHSRNIPSCFVFGGRPCGCSNPSVIASCTTVRSATRALSSISRVTSPSSAPFSSDIIFSMSSPCDRPFFQNCFALLPKESIMVVCSVLLNVPLLHRFLS